MSSPALAPVIPVYLGDPLNITLTFQGMNLMGYIHVAQIRASAADTNILATFTLNKSYAGNDTTITLSLAGDSTHGPDSITRQLGRSAVWDLQQYNMDGSANDTLLVGTLAMTQDVTR